MTRRYGFGTLEDPPPDTAESYKGVRFHCDRMGTGSFTVKAWRGKARRPFAFYSFPNADARAAWIENQKRSEDSRQSFKAERKAARVRNIAETSKRLPVGAILATSWGYEQTNVEFFQVTERRGKATVILREIAGELTQTHMMQGTVTAVPGRFIGEPILRRVGECGVKIEGCRTAYPTEPGKAHHTSWYG
jgi:hypothetical protein